MHELGIAQNIVDIVKQYLPEDLDGTVHSVKLRVGELSGVVPESLDFCFGAIISDTLLAGAKLDIETTAVRSYCNVCRQEFVIEEGDFLCPSCGGNDTELLSGTELQVMAIEITESGQEAS